MFDPESLMFSLPSDEIQQAFISAANEAGYFGWEVYNFSWDLGKYTLTEQQKQQFKLAEKMGYSLGKSISDLYESSVN